MFLTENSVFQHLANQRFITSLYYCILFLGLVNCSIKPGSLKKLKKSRVILIAQDQDFVTASPNVKIQYLGCGGVLLVYQGTGVLVDPFFSHQKFSRIGLSLFTGKNGRNLIRSDPRMIEAGIAAIKSTYVYDDTIRLSAIVNAHSHYDHLMDIPAVHKYFPTIPVLLTASAYNITHAVIDSLAVTVLETHMNTSDFIRPPVILPHTDSSFIHIYPILADHNPHFRNIKFFSGSQNKPVKDYKEPFQKTNPNLWLEGNTFSFLIDFVNEKNEVEYRAFIQSSSCPPPAGIPPRILLDRPVDVAFLGVVSYQFSPDYPCALLDALKPKEIVWVHWEDFFRRYTREPKTVRGTDVAGFFELPCVKNYKTEGKMLWPRKKIRFVY